MTASLGQPQTAAHDTRWPVVLTIVGGALTLLSTVLGWSVDLRAGHAFLPPSVGLWYWTGLTPQNLAQVEPIPRALWIGDVVATLAIALVLVWALAALAGLVRPPWWLVLAAGVAGVALFASEAYYWFASGQLVVALGLSIVGAALLVVAGATARPVSRRVAHSEAGQS